MATRWQDDGVERCVKSPLSLIISAFAPVSDVRYTLTPQCQLDKGLTELLLIDLNQHSASLGGSAFAQVDTAIG